MKEQLEKLKQELREFLEMSKTIIEKPWVVDGLLLYANGREVVCTATRHNTYKEDASVATFIARSRNISPIMAECLLVAVEGLEWMICGCHGSEVCDNDGRGCQACEHAEAKLQQIINIWEASK